MKKLILCGLGALFLCVPQAQAQIPQTEAKYAYIVDFETGAVLLDKSSAERMPTSSMSKVMTMYMVFDALKNGKITMDNDTCRRLFTLVCALHWKG